MGSSGSGAGSSRSMESLWLAGREPVPGEPFVPGRTCDVAVVGAGLTGLVTAVLLARAGREVTVIEAREVGAVTTGHTTAKISLLQGTTYSRMLKHTSEHVARAYVEANRDGQTWLLDYCAERGVAVQRRDAVTYALSLRGRSAVQQEYEAAARIGLDVEQVEPDELPFTTRAAIRLAHQAQFDPMDALAALAADLRTLGGRLHIGVRVQGVRVGEPCQLHTSQGDFLARQIVLATGTPILDRGLYFAKLIALRSYAAAFRVAGTLIPEGMYLSADSATRSLRSTSRGGEELLLVGGNGHVVGRAVSPKSRLRELEVWTTRNFAGAELIHRWSAQDYSSASLVPFAGKLPRGGGAVWVATGYNKWGMTNAVAAGLRISGEMLGDPPGWAKVIGHRVTRPRDLLTGAQANASVGVAATLGWTAAMMAPSTTRPPAEGEAAVVRRGAHPVGVSTVGGSTCAVSLVCPHLKGVLRWNDAELSWDCPLHGSRFTATGTLLEGPATSDLRTEAVNLDDR
jgi:glycine/D-amino acid oxidase-like deaminating enzyme/nitrite reductase/ring-hydroxylating ferredoxin subunit